MVNISQQASFSKTSLVYVQVHIVFCSLWQKEALLCWDILWSTAAICCGVYRNVTYTSSHNKCVATLQFCFPSSPHSFFFLNASNWKEQARRKVMKCLISLWYWYNPLTPPQKSFQRLKLPWMFVFSPSSDQDKYCQSGLCRLLLCSYSVANKKNGLLSHRGRGNRAVCKAIRAVQFTDAVDIRFHSLFSPKECNLSLQPAPPDWWRWLSLYRCQGATFGDNPAKMECLESVSGIAQMLTAGDMLSTEGAHPSSEAYLEIGSSLCQMEQEYDALSVPTASGLELVITGCQILFTHWYYLSAC